MEVHFSQVYIEPGVDFPFSWRFQRYFSQRITGLVAPSGKFIEDYGSDFSLVFNVSAKRTIQENEIRGPTVFRETKDVEYTVFVPFDVITGGSDVMKSALRFLMRGACSVFEGLEIDTSKIVEEEESIIHVVCSDPVMFE